MDKELILKYKAEFDHWLKGGNVQACYIEDGKPKWLTDEKCIEYGGYDNFSRILGINKIYNDILIVIDDSFSEFRKALAEGRTVQYNFGNYGINRENFPNTWKDLDPSIGILADRACPENYRIKPEEPKFKVGDWLIEIHSNSYAKVLDVFTQEVRVKLYDCNSIITTENTDFKLWQPQLGEWCWFWNKDRLPTVAKLAEICNDGNRKYFAIMPNKPHPLGGYYENCEPFIGQLPSYLKE